MATTHHASRLHALLSASGATKWLNCTPSARLEEKFKELEASIYAIEGTLAHEFGDINLKFLNGEITEKELNKELKSLRTNKSYTDEMEEQIEKYTTYVFEALNIAKQKTKDAKLLIEKRLDFSHVVKKGFGTGDAIIVSNDVLEIIDLKYGKGVKVDAENNPQLMLYGLGALRFFDLLYDIKKVKLTIIQPRLNHISSYEMAVIVLQKWGENVVRPTALKAYSGEGIKKAGSWCKWCKAAPMCAELANENLKLAIHDFKDPHLLTEKALLAIYSQMPMLTDWVSAVQKYLLEQAINGKKLQGYKLVPTRSIRRWSDENEVKKVMASEKIDEVDFMQSKLKGITAIEKLLGKSKFKEKVSKFVIKPDSKPTLVPLSDSRKPFGSIEQAKEDFK